jgi:peptidoglycan/LPS O-acetylase OafA/YrhL
MSSVEKISLSPTSGSTAREAGTERPHLLVLDGLRGVAAYSVAIFHFYAGRALPSGWLAVDFFFILSGFVLAHAYGRKLAQGMSMVEFLLHRLVRLCPMIVLGAAFSTIVAILHDMMHPENSYTAPFLVSATASAMLVVPDLWPNRYSDRIFPLNPSEWSLFFELWVSIAFACIVRWLRPNMVTTMLLIALGAFSLWAVGEIGGDNQTNFMSGFPRTFMCMFIGLLVHLAWERGASRGLGAGLVSLGLLTLMVFNSRDVPYLVLYVGSVILFALVVFLGANARGGRRQQAICKHLGALSFPVYMLHFPTWYLTAAVLKRAAIEPPYTVVAALLALTLLSYGALRWIDEPVRAWLRTMIATNKRFHRAG